MLKIVICTKHGGFGLSPEAIIYLLKKGSTLVKRQTFKEAGFNPKHEDLSQMKLTSLPNHFSNWVGSVFDIDNEVIYDIRQAPGYNMKFRTHPDLIEVLETFGEGANDNYAALKVITITDPDITLDRLEIHDFGGRESIHEKHRVWS